MQNTQLVIANQTRGSLNFKSSKHKNTYQAAMQWGKFHNIIHFKYVEKKCESKWSNMPTWPALTSKSSLASHHQEDFFFKKKKKES